MTARCDIRTFWDRVDHTDANGCWTWTGPRNGNGYGTFGPGRAHRVAWELVNGPIPDGLCVLHRCDNPPCVRPDHLWVGTRSENTQDMLQKGRHGAWRHPERVARGERNSGARLTLEQVRAIRAEYATGTTSWTRLALKYGISKRAIGRVVQGTHWREEAA